MSGFGNVLVDTGEGAAAGSVVPGWGTAIGAGLGLAKGIYGAIESGKGPKRPPISANPYTQMALDLAKQMAANKGLTGGDILENKLDNTTSNYVQDAAKSNNSMDFITGLASAMANKYAGQNNLAYEGAQEDKQNNLYLQNTLNNSAQDQNRVQEWNTEGGYQDQLARKSAQTNGIANALGDLGTVTNAYLQGTQTNDFLNRLYGLGKYAPVYNAPLNTTPTSSSQSISSIIPNSLVSPTADYFLNNLPGI